MSFGSSLPAFGLPATSSTTQPATTAFGQPAAGTGTTGGAFGGGTSATNPTAPFGSGSTFGSGQTGGPTAFGGGGGGAFGGGSMFGGGQQVQGHQPAAGPSFFGGGTSTFGQPTGGAQTQTTPSLFGQPTGGQTQTTPSLFGQPAGGQTQTQTQPTGSLFGQPQTQTNPGASLFGGGSTAGTGGWGSFGQSTTQSQPQGGSTFGGFGQSTAQPSAFGGFGGSTLGGSTLGTSSLGGFGGGGGSMFGQTQAQQPLAAVSAQVTPQFGKTTKFNDLPDSLKKVFEDIESHIQGRVQVSKTLKERKLGQEPTKGRDGLEAIAREIMTATNVLRSDVARMRDLRAKVDQASQDVGTARHIIDGAKSNASLASGPGSNAALTSYADFPHEYFGRLVQELEDRVRWYRVTVEKIERKLGSLANRAQTTPQSIATTLSSQNAIFLALAARVAALDGALQRIKEVYTALWRAHNAGSMKDPFNVLDWGSERGGERGLDVGSLLR